MSAIEYWYSGTKCPVDKITWCLALCWTHFMCSRCGCCECADCVDHAADERARHLWHRVMWRYSQMYGEDMCA